MRIAGDKRGVTLIELMVTLTIFSIIITAIYSLYIAILKSATIEKGIAKTELDVVTVFWPLIKEIHTAGYGVPTTGSCTPAVSYASGALTIHSTAAGDDVNFGKWSFVDNLCAVSNIPDGQNVVVINGGNKTYMGTGSIAGGKISPCSTTYYDSLSSIAFWVPSSGLQCYETSFALQNYPSGTRPRWCESNTQRLSRSVSTTTGTTNYQPMLDCVFNQALYFRFGCIDSSGNLTWRADLNCGTNTLRFARVGLVMQNSQRREIQVPATITLFEDLSSPLNVTINLTTDQRYYKWKKIEQTIALRNLE